MVRHIEAREMRDLFMEKNIKKIGIITLNGYHNYGNRLQNYATQEVIKVLGFNVETVIINDITSNDNVYNNIKKKINKVSKMSIKDFYKKASKQINKKINYYMNYDGINERRRIFMDFSKKNILEKFYDNTQENLKHLSDQYDFFVSGSDQVWNPVYKNKLHIYFLTFATRNKRIAYSPSFGVSEISVEHLEQYKMWLTEMASLSVREEAGAKLIKDIANRDAIVLADPTLMLTKEKWLSIAKISPNKPKEKYILTYFLGGISSENQLRIREIAEVYNMKIINLVDLKDKDTYKTGPSEFIDYINSASAFFTDSFHGVVFSILFETPFVIYERISLSASMYSRIETLLDTFKLKSRKSDNITTNEEVFEINYSNVHLILEVEREKAVNYLKNALNV
jgi:hypothetical protein